MREIFLTQYIGAIVIGMLLVQGIGGVISLLVEPIVWYQQNRASHSVIQSTSPILPWESFLPLLIRIGLYFVVSYLLFSLLYPGDPAPITGQATEESGS